METEYSLKLKDPKWISRAKEIRKRDGHKCTKCFVDNVELHVHHKYYLLNKDPWDYPDDALITLCPICHSKEHEGKSISSFTKISKKKQRKRERKKKREQERLIRKKKNQPINISVYHQPQTRVEILREKLLSEGKLIEYVGKDNFLGKDDPEKLLKIRENKLRGRKNKK
jgi:hypothetical protein